jgi:hypothetical protein
VRWDPSNNRNVNAIRVVVDGPGTLVEPNRENNAETLPIDVRTSWELEPVGIRPARSDKADTLRLVAAVRNSGETDARRVAVFFYSSLEQNDETFIGESIVERVPAGQTVEVPFDWDLSTTSLSEMPQVSFAIAIKGSLQRTSSVSEE